MFILRVTSFTLSFTLVPIPLCNLCDLRIFQGAWSKEMSGDHAEILRSLLNHCVSMQEACCENMTVVLGKELQNTSKTLPNHSTSMRGAGFCKGYAGTPLLESRFRGGTHLFLLCHDFRGRVYIVIRSYVYKINIDFGMSPISH